jgi:hypothetical protein
VGRIFSTTRRKQRPGANLKQKLVPTLGFDGGVDWRVIADERVKGGLTVEEIEKEPASKYPPAEPGALPAS